MRIAQAEGSSWEDHSWESCLGGHLFSHSSAETPKRKVGRPRKHPVVISPADIPLPSDSEDETVSDFLPVSRPHVDTRRPIPAPRRVMVDQRPIGHSAAGIVSPPAREIRHSNHCISAIIEESDLSDDDQRSVRDNSFMLEQFRILREENRADIRRLEKDAREERERLLQEQQREREFMNSTILAIQNSVSLMARQNSQPPAPSALAAEPGSGPSNQPITPGTSHAAQQPVQILPPAASTATSEVRQPRLVPPTAIPTPNRQQTTAIPRPNAAERELTLQGEPPQLLLTPEELSGSPDPIKRLRRDESTSDVAAIILNGMGIAKAIEMGKSTKGKTSSSMRRKLRLAKWPHDYVFRYEDEEPSYDSLNISEFVSGYLSIMEEVTPRTPENAKLLKHLDYLRQLMDDCASFEWHQVRAAHRQVLQTIEQHRLVWDNTPAVKEAKALALACACSRPEARVDRSSESAPTTTCDQYQKATCSHPDDHTTDGTLMLHCCAYCYRKWGSQNPHPKANCRKCNRRGNSKNHKGGQ